jgi:hypothetical protein
MLTINQAILSLPESIQAITKKAWINTSRLNRLFDYADSESIYFDLKLHGAFFKACDLDKRELFDAFCEIEYQIFLEELDSIDSREEEIISRAGSRYYFYGDKIHDIYSYSDCEKALDFSLFIDGSRLGAEDFVERVQDYIEDGYPLEELEKDLAFYIEEARYVVKASLQIMQDYKKIYNYVGSFKEHQVENFLGFVEANSY